MTNTLEQFVLSEGSQTETRVHLSVSDKKKTSSRSPNKKVERAVYAYIQAVRALGKQQVNTLEIAEALSMPVAHVERAVLSLRRKGVKPINV